MIYTYLVEHKMVPLLTRDWQAHDKTLIRKRRKLDLAMHAGHGYQESTKINWKTFVSVCEVKYRTQPQLDTEAQIQIVNKAFFTLSSQLNRCYFVGITLCSSRMWVLLFTRGGSVVSAPFDIHHDPHKFLYILAIFMAGDLLWLGYDKDFSVGIEDTLWIAC